MSLSEEDSLIEVIYCLLSEDFASYIGSCSNKTFLLKLQKYYFLVISGVFMLMIVLKFILQTSLHLFNFSFVGFYQTSGGY